MGDAATATQAFSQSRQYRLLSPAEFRLVFQQAQRTSDRYFTLLWRANELGRARIGFAIAKKRVAHAVQRNRIRRIARESFRQTRSTLPNVDVVVLATTAAGSASNAQLFKSLEVHWDRIRQGKTSPVRKRTARSRNRKDQSSRGTE